MTEVSVEDEIMFFIGTHNILLRTYAHTPPHLADMFGDELSVKLAELRRIWETYIDHHRVIIDKNTSEIRDYLQLIAKLLRFDPNEPRGIWFKLGKKFITGNFEFITEIVGAMPRERLVPQAPEVGGPDPLRVRKIVAIVNLIFKKSGEPCPQIMQNPILRDSVGRIKFLFLGFVTKNRVFIDPYFQEYSMEVIQGYMDFDAGNVLAISPMSILLDAIRLDLFDQERQDRLLLSTWGGKCDALENQVLTFRELGELFVKENFMELNHLCKLFLYELKDE
jgi:hypothetical protein